MSISNSVGILASAGIYNPLRLLPNGGNGALFIHSRANMFQEVSGRETPSDYGETVGEIVNMFPGTSTTITSVGTGTWLRETSGLDYSGASELQIDFGTGEQVTGSFVIATTLGEVITGEFESDPDGTLTFTRQSISYRPTIGFCYVVGGLTTAEKQEISEVLLHVNRVPEPSTSRRHRFLNATHIDDIVIDSTGPLNGKFLASGNKLTALPVTDYTIFDNLYGAFQNNKLTSLTTGIIDFSNIVSLSYCFRYNEIASVDNDFFDTLTSIYECRHLFTGNPLTVTAAENIIDSVFRATEANNITDVDAGYCIYGSNNNTLWNDISQTHRDKVYKLKTLYGWSGSYMVQGKTHLEDLLYDFVNVGRSETLRLQSIPHSERPLYRRAYKDSGTGEWVICDHGELFYDSVKGMKVSKPKYVLNTRSEDPESNGSGLKLHFTGYGPDDTFTVTHIDGSDSSAGFTISSLADAGDTYTCFIDLYAGTVTNVVLGIYVTGFAWNDDVADTVFTITEGPGTITSSSGETLMAVTGLSSTIPTRLRINVTGAQDTSRLTIYPGGTGSGTGQSIRIGKYPVCYLGHWEYVDEYILNPGTAQINTGMVSPTAGKYLEKGVWFDGDTGTTQSYTDGTYTDSVYVSSDTRLNITALEYRTMAGSNVAWVGTRVIASNGLIVESISTPNSVGSGQYALVSNPTGLSFAEAADALRFPNRFAIDFTYSGYGTQEFAVGDTNLTQARIDVGSDMSRIRPTELMPVNDFIIKTVIIISEDVASQKYPYGALLSGANKNYVSGDDRWRITTFDYAPTRVALEVKMDGIILSQINLFLPTAILAGTELDITLVKSSTDGTTLTINGETVTDASRVEDFTNDYHLTPGAIGAGISNDCWVKELSISKIYS